MELEEVTRFLNVKDNITSFNKEKERRKIEIQEVFDYLWKYSSGDFILDSKVRFLWVLQKCFQFVFTLISVRKFSPVIETNLSFAIISHCISQLGSVQCTGNLHYCESSFVCLPSSLAYSSHCFHPRLLWGPVALELCFRVDLENTNRTDSSFSGLAIHRRDFLDWFGPF